MRVIGTVGLAGSGKGEAAAVAREEGIPVVTMGDVIREVCRARGVDPATHHGEIAQRLREENGPDAVAARSLPVVEEHLADHDTVLIDGIRSGVEVDRLERAFGDEFTLVSVEVPFEERKARVAERGRDADADAGGESLATRDERELGFGMGEAMDRADVVVENVDSLDAFRRRMRTLFRDGSDALAGDPTVELRDGDRAEAGGDGATGDGREVRR
jgi:dephospho-CoA kinase